MFGLSSLGDGIKLAIAGVVCGALGLALGTWHGKGLGRAEAAAQAAANSVRILQQRGKIDEQVANSEACRPLIPK